VLEQRVERRLKAALRLSPSAHGQAATAFAVQNTAQAGDDKSCQFPRIYGGGTWNPCSQHLPHVGIEVRLVGSCRFGAFRAATDDKHPPPITAETWAPIQADGYFRG